jgi:hypothetical protein
MWGYFENCIRRQQLDAMLATYNLIGSIRFPTRITSGSISAIGNLFIDKTRNYTVSPFINGTSNHDTQVITLNNIFSQ